MRFLTDFGDLAVVLPLALAVALAFLLTGWRRGAAAWTAAVLATLAAVAAGKLAILLIGPVPFVTLKSPSGHTAAGAVVYGGLLVLLGPPRWRAPLAAAAIGLGAATLIGASRYLVIAHSRTEIAVGAVIGVAGTVLLARLAGDRPAHVRRLLPVGAAIAMIALFHGERLYAEDDIARLSRTVWPFTLFTQGN